MGQNNVSSYSKRALLNEDDLRKNPPIDAGVLIWNLRLALRDAMSFLDPEMCVDYELWRELL